MAINRDELFLFIKETRKYKKVMVRDIQKSLGVSKPTVARMYKGVGEVDVGKVMLMLDMLGYEIQVVLKK